MFLKYFRILALVPIYLISSSYTVVEDKSELTVLTPALSERKVKKIRLDNGLEAYLISDPGTHQSGSALAVESGSFHDPIDRPGMAHFIEHMLFMGTEKYPQEEEYHGFLNAHGGKCNAYTADDRTVYSFSCNHDSFDEALDRFASLFISPLFRSSSLQRETLAIDQEFSKDLPLDPWRIIFVKKELANPEHPFHRFSIGNKETLAHATSQELKEWFENHYSSHIMHLVVYSKDPLDVIESQVVDKFSAIKQRNLTSSGYNAEQAFFAPFDHMIAITPLQDLKMLELTFELPAHFSQDSDSHAEDIVAYVLGHEGENSLFDFLRKQSWAEALSAEKDIVGKKRFFSLTVKLTNKGVQEYEKIISTIYSTISSLAQTGIPQYIFDEMTKMKKTHFAYQSREEPFDLVMELAANLIDEPLETFPDKTVMPSHYNPERIKEVLSYLQPEKGIITYIVDPKLIKTKSTHQEKWMGAPYTLIPISEKTLEQWKKLGPEDKISLPAPNPFLPKNLTIFTKEIENSSLPQPELFFKNEKGSYYFQADDRFLTPQISWIITIKTPAIIASQPVTVAMADIYCYLLDKRLNSLSYQASLGGLKYSLKSCDNGLKLTLDGYSEKAYPYLQAIIEEMICFSPTSEEWALGVEFYQSDYKNRLNKTPISQGADLLWNIIYKDYPSLIKKDQALSHLSFNDFSSFCHTLFKKGYFEVLFFGNMRENEGREVAAFLDKSLVDQPYLPSDHFKKAIALFPDNQNPLYLTKKSKLPSNALILLVDCGSYSYEKKAALEILSQGLHEPFFSELRSKQQTGYLVQNWTNDIEGRLYTFFLSQSSTHDTRDLMARFELFFENSLRNLEETVITKNRFEALRSALIVGLEHPADNMKELSPILYKLGFEENADFKRYDEEKKALKNLSYEQFLKYAQEFLGKENHRRLAICVNGKIPLQETISYKPINSVDKLKNTITYEEKK